MSQSLFDAQIDLNPHQNKNPFIQKDKVVITSYPFASRKEEFKAKMFGE